MYGLVKPPLSSRQCGFSSHPDCRLHPASLTPHPFPAFTPRPLPHPPASLVDASTSEPASREPPFLSVKKTSRYEVRFYKPFAVAECDYAQRFTGFDLLGGSYLGGGNATNQVFWSTQPVMMFIPTDTANAPKRMQLYLIARAAQPIPIEQLPAPNSPQVRLNMAGGEVLAAMRFEGNATSDVVLAKRDELVRELVRDGFQVEDEGLVRLHQYGAVFQLARTNEVLCKIKL